VNSKISQAINRLFPYKRSRLALFSIQFLIVTLLPVLLTYELWQEVGTGVRPSAWDGSGHFTLAQIYSNKVFPDTFGWTNGFFGGMPHPNNYPPLFYWLVAFLDHTHLFSFLTSFKLVLATPTLLLPAATYFLAWKISNRNQLVAFCAALMVTPLLVDYRFFISSGPLGITYTSTFLTGLYSHPLGYLFLILWFAVYCDRRQSLPRIVLSAILLALSLLSSFFGASVTALFIVATLAYDLLWLRAAARNPTIRRRLRQSLVGHFTSPIIAGCLTLFWLVPVVTTQEYIVTQPSSIPLRELIPSALIFWYTVAGIGFIVWLRRRKTGLTGVYLAVCFVLAVIIFLAAPFAPHWFPLHPTRLLATLNFLLAVPVGLTAALIFSKLAGFLGAETIISRLKERFSGLQNRPVDKTDVNRTLAAAVQQSTKELSGWQLVGIVLVLLFGIVLVFKGIKPTTYHLAFYPSENREAVDPLLEYAKTHQDGRYLVETPPFNQIAEGHDARAINNFLPMQGNEALGLFFREASPSVVFFSPIIDRFSVQADPTGISSMLSDDIDFANQSAALHIEQARLTGVRYLVVRSPWTRNLLQGQAGIKSRRDFGLWSIYELNGEPERHVRQLAYKPALVISRLNLKGRRNNELNFVRFAEEQIYSGWFDVLLARAQETKLDKQKIESGFGALIVDTYDYDDEQRAFELLREFAQHRQLILLEDDNPLFRRIQTAVAEFPQAAIISRSPEEPGEWLKQGAPSRSYENSQIRHLWRQIQPILDRNKISSIAPGSPGITGEVEQNKVTVNLSGSPAQPVPVLIDMTYHPNWQRSDEAAVYPVTPFFMLTFVQEPLQLTFARKAFDWIGLIISAVTFLLLCLTLIYYYGKDFGRRVRQNKPIIAATIPVDKELSDD
jgi:hypothetical protein